MNNTQLWAIYRTDTHENPFGRDFVGYAGWHENSTSALAEAARRHPELDANILQVNRA